MTSFVRRFGTLVGLTAIGYILSFCSQLLISAYFGTTSALDAYWMSLALVNFVCFYAQPWREALVPALYNAWKHGEEEVSEVLAAGLTTLMILVSVSVGVLWVFSGWFTCMMAGDAEDTEEILVKLMPWLIPYMFVFNVAETLNMALVSFDRILRQTAIRLAASVLFIICVFAVGNSIGASALLMAQIASLSVVAVLSITTLRSLKIKLPLKGIRACLTGLDWAGGRGIYPLFGTLTVTYFLAQVWVLAERWAMSGFSVGLISAYQYGNMLTGVVSSLIAFPLSNLLWPKFLDAYRNGEKSYAEELAVRSGMIIAAALAVVCMFTWKHSEKIVTLLFARGAFDEASISLTTMTLRATIFTAIPMSLITIFSRLLLSSGKGYRQAWVGIATVLGGAICIGSGIFFHNQNIVINHWFLGNVVGLFVSVYFLKKDAGINLRGCSRVFLISVLVFLLISGAAVIVPSVDLGEGKFFLAASLVVDWALYASICTTLIGMVCAVVYPGVFQDGMKFISRWRR